MRRFAVLLFALSLVLLTGAYSRDRFDLWIADTEMPALVLPTGAQILDRNGQLLRAYTVADGRWRLHVALADVDPGYIAADLAQLPLYRAGAGAFQQARDLHGQG